MRRIFIAALFLVSFKSYSQLMADPALGQVSFTNIAGAAIDDTMPLGYVAQLNVPIKNLHPTNGLPAGSCKIKIGLGTKMILGPGFNIGSVPSSQYLSWTAAVIGGQVQLTGELIAPLPANYSVTEKFNVQGSVLNYSTITANFLTTNHNTQVILSDEDPTNNNSFRLYKIIPTNPIPVNFKNVSAANRNCNIFVAFTAENEINVANFEIETSKDGLQYNKAATLNANHRINYSYQLPITAQTESPILYLRIKSIDKNGSFKYSAIKTVNALCNNNASYLLYPNPANNTNQVTIKVSNRVLNGKYLARLYDVKGSLVSTREFTFSGQQQFNYPLRNIASGKYVLKLINSENEITILQFQK